MDAASRALDAFSGVVQADLSGLPVLSFGLGLVGFKGQLSIYSVLGFSASAYFLVHIVLYLLKTIWFFVEPQPPKVFVELCEEETDDILEGYDQFDPKVLKGETKVVHLWDPSTMDYFGDIPAMGKAEVDEIVAKSRVAQEKWKKSSFATRRQLMRTMQVSLRISISLIEG